MARADIHSPGCGPSKASKTKRSALAKKGPSSLGAYGGSKKGSHRPTSKTKTSLLKRKRKAESVSSDASSSELELDDDDEGDDSDSSSEDDDDPAEYAPSYGKRKSKGYKAGLKTNPSPGSKKRMKLDDNGYAGQDNADSGADSSDDGYGAVDEISDADDDEDLDVEKLEEQMIVQSEEGRNVAVPVAHPQNGNFDDWAGLESIDDQFLFSTASFFEDEQFLAQFNHFESTADADLTSEAVETPIQRRVHFEDQDDSSSSSVSSDEEEPSDFLQQDSLDPTLRRMIESENDGNDNRHSDDFFGEHDYGRGNIYHTDSETSSNGSSGYETDDGETTDEDLPPPATITHPRSILRRDSSASLQTQDIGVADRPEPPRRRGPVMGTFIADRSKPVALVDCTGQHLVIIPAYASTRHEWLDSATNSISGTANNSPRTATMQHPDESDTDALLSPTRPDLSPMLSSSANLMMTALGNEAHRGGQVTGPPEAFYPAAESTYDEDEEEDDDGEDNLNVDDFIDFGNGSSDEEIDVGENEPRSPLVTPNRASESHPGSSAERLLNHLDRGIVTAFRRNHNRYQALIRLPQHREFMPANSPSRPASVFRNAKHMDPKTPTRKRKASNYAAGGEAVRRKLMDAQRRNQITF